MLELARINRGARYALAFIFVYHGLVPKILWLDPLETAWAASHHMPVTPAVFAAGAGLAEISLGLSIVWMRRSLVPVYLAATLLVVLLLDAVVFAPATLTGAFNPVTTNIAALALCQAIRISHTARARQPN